MTGDAADVARRRWAAGTVGLAVVMSVLDGVMVNVALPSIGRSLGTTPAASLWVVSAYQLAVALALLPLGKLADILGHRRVYLASLAVFTIGSAGCVLSQGLTSLSIWRFVQGVGGAGIMGITNAMLRFIYPPKLLARGISINSVVVALSLASGPTIASLIVTLADWRWLFLVNLPAGIVFLVIGARMLPVTPGSGDRFDSASALMTMGTFGALIMAIDTTSHGNGIAVPMLLAMVGGIVGVGLVRRQLRVASPILAVDLLRTRMFGLSVGTMFAAAAAQIIAYLSLPFFFQADLGRTQIDTGLLFLPWPIAIAAIAPIAGRLGDRVAAARLCAIGLTLFAIGLLSLAMLDRDASTIDIALRMALCGLGYGFFQPPNSRVMIASVPITRSGSASVTGAAGRVLGQAAGAALVTSIFRLAPGDGRQTALLLAAGIALLAAVASVSRGVPAIRSPRASAADRTN